MGEHLVKSREFRLALLCRMNSGRGVRRIRISAFFRVAGSDVIVDLVGVGVGVNLVVRGLGKGECFFIFFVANFLESTAP
jgi:hypothetical protein